jgi:hypothetical protein
VIAEYRLSTHGQENKVEGQINQVVS